MTRWLSHTSKRLQARDFPVQGRAVLLEVFELSFVHARLRSALLRAALLLALANHVLHGRNAPWETCA